MVNYDWELRYYRGCLIAVSSKCIAYALRGTGVIFSNISNTRDCFITFPNAQKRNENTMHKKVFLTHSEVFGNVVKYYLKCLIYLLNQNLNSGENHQYLC